jgi:hypothetical protein
MSKSFLRSLRLLFALALAWFLMATEPEAAQNKKPKKGNKPADTTGEAPGTPVRTDRDPAPVARSVDRLIDERLAADKIPASPLCDDAEFIRRLSLDLRGRIPVGERVATFLADSSPDKRAKLIDEFLGDGEYGEHFAIVWYHRMVKPDDDNRAALRGNHMVEWLAERFNNNVGWDRTVSDILTASGDRDAHPATTFWLAQIGDAKAGQPEPNKATGAASRLFLGIRLECCECHNHPFAKLKQTDFWTTAAFFTQTHADSAGKKDQKGGATPAIHEGGGAVRKKKGEPKTPAPFGSIAIPFKDKVVPATFLGSASPAEISGETSLRPLFAAWTTSAKNPYFARATANKLWANFFGRGIVNPVDDMREDSVNTHPEVLTLLATELAESGFDLKHLTRCICLTKAYQRTSATVSGNKDDVQFYSHMPVKVMSADMLYDSLAVVLGHGVGDDAKAAPKKKGMNKKQGFAGPREQFRHFFHAEADDDSGVVEDYTHGIPQVLRLMNSRQTNELGAAVGRLTRGATPDRNIETLFLATLSRKPSEVEAKRMQAYLDKASSPSEGYGDILWALLNSGEFVVIH